ncbi:hypothetical protein D3C81_1965920 [compost metagenome]
MGMVGMPIPSTRQVSMVNTSERNRLSRPRSRMYPAKVVARPVSEMTPIMTPTSAQAMPTGTA